MSFYNDASLVVIPSGYKTSKVYAEKPTDGSGDLAFTRTGDTATRVNSAGLIERVRTNLLTYSQDVTNAAWTKSATTASANTTTAPDGTTTADTITETATSAQHAFFNSFTTGASIATFSVYLKANGRNFATIYPQGTSMAGYATVNLSNGTINTTGGSTFLRAAIESAGNGWYRIQVALTTTANSLACVVYLSNTLGGISPTYLGDGTSGVFVWGAQLETGDVATAYIPTTSAAVSVGPVANVPRLDYLGSTCPRLLLEPQRTNLFTNSETFDSANWVKSGATITANVAVSPDGYTNADLQTGGEIYQQKVQPNATACTMSVFVKKDTAANVTIRYIDNVSGFTGGGITYTYATNAITINQSPNASVSGEAISYGNGWYRLILKYTTIASVTFNYQGIQASGSFIYGAQLETSASYATSYIPTLAASATRGADACSKTGISSLIGQTEGTIFLDFVYDAENTANERFSISDGTSAKRIFVVINTSKLLSFTCTNAGSDQWNISTSLTVGQRYKIAGAYKANDIALYVNGVQIGTDAAASIPDCSNLYFANESGTTQEWNNPTSQLLLFKTRLTNAQLAELTTL